MNKKMKTAVRETLGVKALNNAKQLESEYGSLVEVKSKTSRNGRLEMIGVFGSKKTLKKIAEFKNGKFS